MTAPFEVRPTALPVDADGIPDELKLYERWVVWRWTWKAEERKWDKPPFQAARPAAYASVDRPATWGSFADAMGAYTHGRCDGIGFVLGDLGDGKHVSGLDLDDCVTPAKNGTPPSIAPSARELLLGWDSFAEYSPSGEGIKGLCWGAVEHSAKSEHIEVYPGGRYFTLTGQRLEHMPARLTDAPHHTGAIQRVFAAVEAEKVQARAAATAKRQSAYAAKALHHERDAVAFAGDGTRHNQLVSSARALFGLVDEGLLTEREVIDTLAEASTLPDQEIDDALTWARDNPSARSVPDFGAPSSNGRPAEPRSLNPDKYNRSDAGNGELFVALFGDDYRYDLTREKWLAWTGARWTVDEYGGAAVSAVAVARLRRQWAAELGDADAAKRSAAWAIRSEQRYGVAGTLELARIQPGMTVQATDYDTHPLLAGIPGGTLDLSLGVAREARREDRVTQQLGVAFEPSATCPRWEQFLVEIFDNEVELINYIQRAVGYTLTGDVCEHAMFLLYGSGANGKSVLLNTLLALLGDYGASTPFATFDAERRSDNTNDLAALRAARLVVATESDEERRLAEARVKAMTGADAIACRFLYGEFFRYRPQFKVWLSTNHLPVVRGSDYGIWRRIKLIPFKMRFTGADVVPDLEAQLRGELAGILNWALKGLAAWRENGLGSCQAVDAATSGYRRDSDLLGQWLEDATVRDHMERTTCNAAFDSFKDWCEREGYRVWSRQAFGRAMTEKEFERIKSGGWYYTGFRLLANGYE